MSSIKMNGELVPLSKEVLFPSDKSERALVDMQRGQWRLCARRKPPIYGQTLLHITLTTSREKAEWSESQPLQPSRCCRNPWKAKPVRFSRICRYIRDAVKLRGPFSVSPSGWLLQNPRVQFARAAEIILQLPQSETVLHSREQIQGVPQCVVTATSGCDLQN